MVILLASQLCESTNACLYQQNCRLRGTKLDDECQVKNGLLNEDVMSAIDVASG